MAAVNPAAARPASSVRARKRLRWNVVRVVLLVVFALFFLVPLGTLVEFSTRGLGDAPRTLDAWRSIADYPDLLSAIWASLELAVLTSVVSVALLLPTMIWVRLRVPGLSRLIEFLCLLPLTIPAIVLVVGWAPLYQWVTYLSPGPLKASPLALVFAYIVLVLPYLYRALDSGLAAIDVPTLSEAARSLGASWFTVILRVVMPNMRSAVLNAQVLAVALVLGEFTVASLLQYVNVQVAMNQVGQADPRVAYAVASAALILTFLLLLAIAFLGRSRTRSSSKEN
jgi:putative spermidine/putrescine transport system permease protein